MTDADRIEALLDLVNSSRVPTVNPGPRLAVLGLATQAARGKGVYRPTNAGWVMLGEKGRAFQPIGY